MIKLNLTPIEELESEYWWILDVATLVSSLLVSVTLVFLYIQSQKLILASKNNEIEELNTQIGKISEKVKKHDSLTKEVGDLKEKIKFFRKLIDSDIARYKPLIIIENLQRLKPKGLWFTKLEIEDPYPKDSELSSKAVKPKPGDFQIPDKVGLIVQGSAKSHRIVSEFMGRLRATKTQDYIPDDIRTQVFFSEIVLESSEKKTVVLGTEEHIITNFTINLEFKNKEDQIKDNRKLNKFIRSLED